MYRSKYDQKLPVEALTPAVTRRLQNLPLGHYCKVKGLSVKCVPSANYSRLSTPCEACIFRDCRSLCNKRQFCFAHRHKSGKSVVFILDTSEP